jgi:hypothetical protein
MTDEKLCNAITNTQSTQVGYAHGATEKDMNNTDTAKIMTIVDLEALSLDY